MRASSTHRSSRVDPTGTKGRTSVAPMRGCSPRCRRKSISSVALRTPLSAASTTASASPTNVMTHRLWSAFISWSNRRTDRSLEISAAMALTTDKFRPSLKLGTHSTSSLMPSPYRDRGSPSGTARSLQLLYLQLFIRITSRTTEAVAAIHHNDAALHRETHVFLRVVIGHVAVV